MEFVVFENRRIFCPHQLWKAVFTNLANRNLYTQPRRFLSSIKACERLTGWGEFLLRWPHWPPGTSEPQKLVTSRLLLFCVGVRHCKVVVVWKQLFSFFGSPLPQESREPTAVRAWETTRNGAALSPKSRWRELVLKNDNKLIKIEILLLEKRVPVWTEWVSTIHWR